MSNDNILEATVAIKDKFSKELDKMRTKVKDAKEQTKGLGQAFNQAEGQVDAALGAMVAGMQKAESKASGLDKKLAKLYTRKGSVSINANVIDGEIDAVEKRLSALTGRPVSIRAKTDVDKRDLKAAETEAERLKKLLSEMTGKKYDIDIDVGGNAISAMSSGGGLFATAAGGLKNAGGAFLGGMAGAAGFAGAAALGAGAIEMSNKVISGGNARQQNMVAMTHFMGGDTGAARGMLDWASDRALITQFSEGEVQSTARRAIQVTGGDEEKAKRLTNLAMDMTSLTPGKSLDDAIEALADADMGEMERLKEFGFKGSKEDYDAAGGDLFKMKSSKGQTLDEVFKGGTDAGADTASAKIGTVLGTLEGALANVGEKLLDGVAPALDVLVEKSEPVGEWLEGTLTSIGETFMNVWNAVQPLAPVFSALWSVVSTVASAGFGVLGGIINGLVVPALNAISTVVSGLVIPAFTVIKGVIDGVVVPAFNKVKEVAQPAIDLAKNGFEILKGKAEGVVDKLAGLQSKAEAAADWLGRIPDMIKGIPDAIGSLASSAASGIISSVKSFFGVEKNATGAMSFSGGFTQMNENTQGEIVKLPNGSRIFPYQTTKEIITKMAKNSGGVQNNNVFNINVDARGSNMTNEQVYRLKKGIIQELIDAFDNTVPA